MGNSPSRGGSQDGSPIARHVTENEQQERVYNPFDRVPPAVNFPEWSRAVQIDHAARPFAEEEASGPSIDMLASLYPLEFPLR